MFRKITSPVLGALFGFLFLFSYGLAQEKTTTTTTTMEQTTQTPVKKSSSQHVRKTTTKAKATPEPQTTTSVYSTTTTTEVKPKIIDRKVYDEGTLKKLGNNLCANGFKAYVGNVKTNVCLRQANPPDISYTCVWNEKGPQAFPSNTQGPCNLDYTEHHGSITIRKDNFPNPPLAFGTEAQCCYRAAKGPESQPAK